jgi:putative ABC transport system permease protein
MPEWRDEVRKRLADLRLEPTREAEITEELSQHLEDRYEMLLRGGASEEEARRAVLLELSEGDLLTQELRRVERPRPQEPLVPGVGGGRNVFGDLWQDLRYGVRVLRKKPGFALVAIVALALGIGANTAIFSVVNTVLLSPLPYREPGRLVWLYETNPTSDIKDEPVSLPNYNDWKNQSQSFEGMAAFVNAAFNLTSEGEPERMPGAYVTADLFSVLGVEPLIGRGFRPEENQVGNHRVVILSDGLWRRRFGASPQVVGQSAVFNGVPHTVVGVMPPDFKNPATDPRHPAQLWAPLPININPASRRSDYLSLVARLKPNVSLGQARAEMGTLTSALATQYPEANAGWSAVVVPLQERIVGDARTPMLLLMGIVGFLLLIACANVANLLLARSAARQQEIAVRQALGANRRRLVRQFLTESVLLALVGGALGLLLAFWGIEALVGLSPGDIPRLEEVGISWSVFAFTLTLSLLTGVVFGLLPALHATKMNLSESLKEGGRSSTEGIGSNRLRSALVVSEMAISLMLLIGAGLVIKSFIRLQEVDPGFKPERILTINVALPGAKYREDTQRVAFTDQLLARVAALPRVESAAVVSALPLGGGENLSSFSIEGRPAPPPNQVVDAEYRIVSPGYFATMGIPLLRGNGFTERDDANTPRVMVINETMARKYWPGEDPIGKRINLGDPSTSPWRTIVGIVRDGRNQRLDAEPYPQMYAAYAQSPTSGMTLVTRAAAEPLSLVPAIRGELVAIDKDQPLYNVRTMEQVLWESVARQRFNMLLITIFAGIGLILAAVGIYGVISYSVTQRTHEIGIRMALGAQSIDVLKMVLGQGLLLAVVGIGVGIGAALLLTRVMASLLFGVSATDPLTFLVISLLLTTVALLACYIPARRAMRVDPMIALRHE